MFQLLYQPQKNNFNPALNQICVQVMLKGDTIVRDKAYGVFLPRKSLFCIMWCSF